MENDKNTPGRLQQSEALSKRNNYEDTYEENLEFLASNYSDKILFDMKDVANILSMSYEYVRIAVNNEIIKAKKIGKRRLIHRGELARLITEGVNNVS